jgi:hypothetical protein
MDQVQNFQGRPQQQQVVQKVIYLFILAVQDTLNKRYPR